jgi:hypothetical protein
VSGLAEQVDLLQLAHELEQQRGIEDLALVRTNSDDAWFTVTVHNQDALAEALVRIGGFEVDARPHAAGVDAFVQRISETPSLVGADRASEAVAPAEPSTRAWRPRLWESRWRGGSIRNRNRAVGESVTAIDEAPAEAGGTEHSLIAYPFRSIAVLNLFQDTVRALDGVTGLRVRRFFRGTLHLEIDYTGDVPLIERLQDLRSFSWRLMATSPTKIEITLDEHGDLAAGG